MLMLCSRSLWRARQNCLTYPDEQILTVYRQKKKTRRTISPPTSPGARNSNTNIKCKQCLPNVCMIENLLGTASNLRTHICMPPCLQKVKAFTATAIATQPQAPVTGSTVAERQGLVRVLVDRPSAVMGRVTRVVLDGPRPVPEALYEARRYASISSRACGVEKSCSLRCEWTVEMPHDIVHAWRQNRPPIERWRLPAFNHVLP